MTGIIIALVVLSLAFWISFCLNVIFCIRQRTTLCKDRDKSCVTDTYTGESPSQDSEQYLHHLNHDEQQETPIYGNISSDRRDSVEVCYEMMTMRHTRDRMESSEPDLNYASLNLKMAKKHKKNRHQKAHAQGGSKLEEEQPVHYSPPLNAFLEVEADVDAHLPSRDTSTMVSHSSIYLNSQQIAQETEDMERERGMNMKRENVGYEGIRRREDGKSREWKGEQEYEGRKDVNGAVCAQLSGAEAFQSGMDHFTGSFSHDSDQQD